MKMKEVQAQTGLSRKAIAYYQQKGLIEPVVGENAYRDFSPEQVERLWQVAFLRDLDLSVEEIARGLAEDGGQAALGDVLRERALWDDRQRRKQAILDHYARQGYSEDIRRALDAILREESVARRFERLLPGAFGQLVLVNLLPYLQQPLTTPAQEEAFQQMLMVLDDMPSLALPDDLRDFAEQAGQDMPLELMQKTAQHKADAVRDVDRWLEDNRDRVAQYLAWRQSPEYEASPAARLSQVLKAYFDEHGYYARVIPLMRRLSPAYDAYVRQMLAANERLMEQVPQSKALL